MRRVHQRGIIHEEQRLRSAACDRLGTGALSGVLGVDDAHYLSDRGQVGRRKLFAGNHSVKQTSTERVHPRGVLGIPPIIHQELQCETQDGSVPDPFGEVRLFDPQFVTDRLENRINPSAIRLLRAPAQTRRDVSARSPASDRIAPAARPSMSARAC